jgi:hypothetical protein
VCVCEAKFLKASRVAIDKGEHAELLGEPLELTERRGSLGQVDEVCLDPALSEEAKRLTSVRVFLDAEDLDFHD